MGTQTSALLKGFDYQHLLSWYHILPLLDEKIKKVKLENSEAGHVDDLTVFHSNGFVDFFQIKYHVNSGHYSIEDMLDSRAGTSLLEKFWITWKKLSVLFPGDKIRLILYSNWVQHPEDEILACISGENGLLDQKFFTATTKSKCGRKRAAWRKSHGASEDEFNSFTKSIAFHFGRNFTSELKNIIRDRMVRYHLRDDDDALTISEGIVKEWIKSKTEEITPELLKAKLVERVLHEEESAEKSVAVYLATIKDRKFDLEPDYVLDWRHYFHQVAGRGDHEPIDSEAWNKAMMPELIQLEERLNSENGARLIRARGYSRLSAWFALGHTFSEVSGYKIEVDQQNKLWRSDEKGSANFELVEDIELANHPTKEYVVAVGISITGSLTRDVKKYLEENAQVDATLFLSPKNGIGRESITSNADLTALVAQVKQRVREFVQKNNAKKLLLFYFGPLSGACFIGHQLNATCKEIQIMENTSDGSYIPSFQLFN